MQADSQRAAGGGPHRRGRDTQQAHRVATPLELLFDLSFVVAIAQAAVQLHHGLAAHHVLPALGGFLLAFAAIWWAWMNYTWFASAYDDDSSLFKLLTMVQMAGVLVFSAGVVGLFNGDFRAAVAGYSMMRLALVTQWLLAGRGHPEGRRACRRYALGILLVQTGWLAFMLASVSQLIGGVALGLAVALLWLCELAVPVWAERASNTPWHAHHIAERYGLLLIITLGECVLGATNSVAGLWAAQGWSLDLALVSMGGTALVFSLWWLYFLAPFGQALHHHRERAFVWGYGHFVVLASAAAMGAGLEVVAEALAQEAMPAAAVEHVVSPLYAITVLAMTQAVYMVSLWLVQVCTVRSPTRQPGQIAIGLLCVALGPLAMSLGLLPMSGALLLLPLGPAVAIGLHEHRRRHARGEAAVA